jgi:redox-sensitive bicupin YhaK (pirin superfamily)
MGKETAVTLQRRIARIVTTGPAISGFAGPGHSAVEVVSRENFAATNPFIVLMDDRIDERDAGRIGQAHPHAGIETITFILEGSLHDGDAPALEAGDVQWMTAGSGIIHDEDVTAKGFLRLLQAWLILPDSDRWTTPTFQNIHFDQVPVRREPGVELRLYSGRSGQIVSPTRNRLPVTLADIRLEPGATFEQDLPGFYNGFLYVLAGSARIGDDAVPLKAGQVGWLDRPNGDQDTALLIAAEAQGARLALYSGKPLDDLDVVAGPFSAATQAEIDRKVEEYRAGRFVRLSDLADPTRAGQSPFVGG